jgi:ABC-type sugar transport system substrate-binding protein
VAQKPLAIVLHAYSAEGIVPALEAMERAKIPCILFDFEVASDKYVTLITDNQGLNGEIQARFLLEWLAKDSSRRANVGYLVGSYNALGAMPRRDQFYAVSGIRPLAEQEGGWSANGAMTITEDWLQAYPQMNVFACMNDDMAIGVIQALRSAGKNMNDFLVLGVDGSDAAKPFIRSGDLAATAARDVNLETAFTLDTVEQIIDGRSVGKLLRPNAITAMTRDNVDSR